ncbi:Ig-like domain-containing protein [Nocardioides bruguierae]|uniref:Cadherin-like domain-containing protein n=1 Tax=Nocardioides bruguierae TaxID=2945102 RepID=A0A9X2D5I8_9ACTN|nr:Ig-like domain-containing protein [Nocardioides bruguierae]MCM0619546.1 cadherin-like domain-containing protein [Nocardioides bruguierae]
MRSSRPRSSRRPWALRAPRVRSLLAGLLAAATTAAGVVALPTAASASVPTCASAGLTVTSLGGPNFYIGSGSTPSFLSGYTGYRVLNASGAPLDDLYVTLGDFTGGALDLAAGQAPTQRVGDLADAGDGERFWYLTASGASALAQQHTVTVSQHRPGLPSSSVLCTTSGGFTQVAQTTSANANKVETVTVDGGTPTIGSTFTVTVTGTTGTIGAGVIGDSQSFWMTPSVDAAWPADAFRLIGTELTMSPDGSAPAITWTNTLRLADLGASARPYTAVYTFRAVGFTHAPATVRPVHQIASGNLMKYTGSYPASLPPITPPDNDLTAAATADPATLPTGGGTTTVTTAVAGTAGAELDEVGLTPPDGASVVPGTATWCGEPVGDPELVDGVWVVTGPFVLMPGGCDFVVDVLLDGTPGDQDITVEPTVGDSIVGTSTDVVDGSNAAGVTVEVNTPPVTVPRTVVVDPGGWASVPLHLLASDPDGDPLVLTDVEQPLDGTAFWDPSGIDYLGDPLPEGDPVGYTVSDGRGGTATGTLLVLPFGATPTAAPQTITVEPVPDQLVGDEVLVRATATSGLPVALATTTPETCSVVDHGDGTATVTALAEGECVLVATQDGDEDWAAATPVEVPVTVTRAPQVLTLDGALPTGLEPGGEVDLSVLSDAGLPVGWTSLTPEVCTVDEAGHVVTLAAGTCRLEASQPGDAAHLPAEPLVLVLTVTGAAQPQVVTASGPAQVRVGGTATVLGEATSELPVTFTSLTPETCSVDEQGAVTALAEGACDIEVSQEGDDAWLPAEPVVVRLAVVPRDAQLLGLGAPAVVLAGPAPVTVTATSSAGLPVSFVAAGACTVLDVTHAEGASSATLSVTDPGACEVEAQQPGDADHAPAQPVSAALDVVTPVDDVLRVPAGTTAAVVVDVLDNDPAGPVPSRVGRAEHGATALRAGTVTYRPRAGYRGADAFTYTVRDEQGRTATATVSVRVANAAPSLVVSDVRQPAGTTRTVRLRVADPNRDDVVVTAAVDEPGVTATVREGRLVLRAGREVSGHVRVRLTATDEVGATASAVLVDVVTPPRVRVARQRFVEGAGRADTRVSWSPAPTTDARYEVLVDGQRVCVTADLLCDLDRVLGPTHQVRVRVLGRDGTASGLRTATRTEGSRVWMATVYFDPDEWELTDGQRTRLEKIARRIVALGFGRAYVEGYTDADGDAASNLRLAHARTGTVAALLAGRGIGSDQAWFGEDDPVASNATTTGKSQNRRVEIYIGW